jgi:uncharacterized membrane protein
MFIGHFGVGFGLKRWAPQTSVAWLIGAAIWADILWTIFLLLGWEHARVAVGDTRFTPIDLYDYPWSHSLLFMALWAITLGVVYRAFRGYVAGAVAIGIGVVSHWVLDWLTHRPDMPLYPNGPKYGVGLWNSIGGTLIVEMLIFVWGVWLYARSSRARDRVGRYAFWGYVAMLLVLYVGDRFGGPPNDMKKDAISGMIAMAVLLAWPWWFDGHRDAVESIRSVQQTSAQES